MTEKMTYEPVTTLREQLATVTRMQERIALLEAQLNAATLWMAAVPVDAIRTLYDGLPVGLHGGDLVSHLDAIGDWLMDIAPLSDDEVQP